MGIIKKDWSAGDKVNASDLNTNFEELEKSGVVQFVAGETIVAGNALAVGDGGESADNIGGDATEDQMADINNQFAQKFTTPSALTSLKSIYITHGNSAGSGSGTWSFQVDIYADNAGQPTGASLGTATGSYSSSGTPALYPVTYTFSSPVVLSPSTNYHYVLKVTGVSGYGAVISYASNYFRRNNTGSTGTNESTDGGVNWTGINGAIKTTLTYYVSVAGRVYKANATSSNFKANAFVGFAEEGGNNGDTIYVRIGGINDNQTGLTVGSTYYLSDTGGAIGTSAGSQSRKIGIAVATTKILIKHDNV